MTLRVGKQFPADKLAFVQLRFDAQTILRCKSVHNEDQYLEGLYTRAMQTIPRTLDFEGDYDGEYHIYKLSTVQAVLPDWFREYLCKQPTKTNYTIIGDSIDKERVPGPSQTILLKHLKLRDVQPWCTLWFDRKFFANKA